MILLLKGLVGRCKSSNNNTIAINKDAAGTATAFGKILFKLDAIGNKMAEKVYDCVPDNKSIYDSTPPSSLNTNDQAAMSYSCTRTRNCGARF